MLRNVCRNHFNGCDFALTIVGEVVGWISSNGNSRWGSNGDQTPNRTIKCDTVTTTPLGTIAIAENIHTFSPSLFAVEVNNIANLNHIGSTVFPTNCPHAHATVACVYKCSLTYKRNRNSSSQRDNSRRRETDNGWATDVRWNMHCYSRGVPLLWLRWSILTGVRISLQDTCKT